MKQYYPALSFADINYAWIQKYEQYMRETLLNHPNTIWKSLKFINTMLNLAIKIGGIIQENPFKNYNRAKYKQGIPNYIEWSEAQVNNHTEISSHSFRRGYAMRCAELGMSIDDVQKLMGHNKRSSTEIYFRVKSQRLDGMGL